jgi:FkbM family methyltransferase
VIAFEPLPRNLGYLKKHLQLNHVDNVKIIEAAVSNTEGTTWFKMGADVQTSMGSIVFEGAGNLEVKMVVLDKLVASKAIPGPDFIKMDIEGAELYALQGANTILEQYHPTIFLATHGKIVHKECCEFLVNLGYQLKALDNYSIEDTDEIMATYHR